MFNEPLYNGGIKYIREDRKQGCAVRGGQAAELVMRIARRVALAAITGRSNYIHVSGIISGNVANAFSTAQRSGSLNGCQPLRWKNYRQACKFF